MLYSLKLPQTQTEEFIGILLQTMLNPKHFSLTIKGADEIFLRISAFEISLKILLRMDCCLSGEHETQLSMAAVILGTSSNSNPSIRQSVLRKITKKANSLPRIFLVSLQLFIIDTNEPLRILSAALLRAISEKHQKYFFAECKGSENISRIQSSNQIEQNESSSEQKKDHQLGIDYSQSLQYQVVYLFAIYMNHPQYLRNNSSANWKHFEIHLWESLDVLLVAK